MTSAQERSRSVACDVRQINVNNRGLQSWYSLGSVFRDGGNLRDLEAQLAQLTDAEKAQLMMKLLPALSHAFAGIERKPASHG
jgi:hypothetical protein